MRQTGLVRVRDLKDSGESQEANRSRAACNERMRAMFIWIRVDE